MHITRRKVKRDSNFKFSSNLNDEIPTSIDLKNMTIKINCTWHNFNATFFKPIEVGISSLRLLENLKLESRLTFLRV